MPTDLIEPHPDLAPERAALARGLRLPGRHARPHRGRASRCADNAAQEVDAAIAEAHLDHRLRSLAPDVPGLGFGRLDDEDAATPGTSAAATSRTTDGEPVVVDWRAPVSHALLPGHRRRPARACAGAGAS